MMGEKDGSRKDSFKEKKCNKEMRENIKHWKVSKRKIGL